MASKTEGIALLSMYNDEEDEDDEEEPMDVAVDPPADAAIDENDIDSPPPPNPTSETTPPPPLRPPTPIPFDGDPDRQTLASPIPRSPSTSPPPKVQVTVPFNLPSPPPPPPQMSLPEPVDAPVLRRGTLAIVDYAHDETAMSPEAEEGEIVSGGGSVMIGSDMQTSDGNIERTPPGNVHILTSNTQPEPSQPSDTLEQHKSEATTSMDFTETEAEEAQAAASEETHNDDPLSKFLPPPVAIKCPADLQEKIKKFLLIKEKEGKSFNADLRNKKDYRNPNFLQHAVRYQDIDQIGTCFSKDVFDPHGYEKCDYYDEIEADMKRENERREHERKKSQKVEFISGGAQPAAIAQALKIGTQIPVTGMSAVPASGLQSLTTGVDAISSRQNKKTKWDKVDGDVKNPSHDNSSTVSATAVHLSAANAGTGYTAFAQQKRREAEEKKSSERKLEKRS